MYSLLPIFLAQVLSGRPALTGVLKRITNGQQDACANSNSNLTSTVLSVKEPEKLRLIDNYVLKTPMAPVSKKIVSESFTQGHGQDVFASLPPVCSKKFKLFRLRQLTFECPHHP